MALIKKLRKKKKEAPANEKPDVVKTHLRNMVRFESSTTSNATSLYSLLRPRRETPRCFLSTVLSKTFSGYRARDDWVHCWRLQRQSLHTGEAEHEQSRESLHPVKRMVWTPSVPYCVPTMGQSNHSAHNMGFCPEMGIRGRNGTSCIICRILMTLSKH